MIKIVFLFRKSFKNDFEKVSCQSLQTAHPPPLYFEIFKYFKIVIWNIFYYLWNIKQFRRYITCKLVSLRYYFIDRLNVNLRLVFKLMLWAQLLISQTRWFDWTREPPTEYHFENPSYLFQMSQKRRNQMLCWRRLFRKCQFK